MRVDSRKVWKRLGTIVGLVEGSPQRKLGRTAIVKLLYLMQEVRGMPLGYRFSLYTFGPFDSDVLDDLGYGQALRALSVKTVLYSSNYRYEVRPGAKSADAKECVADWLESHEEDIAWAAENFGGRSAAELELLATIVYVDRELAGSGGECDLRTIADRVHKVKPHFGEQYVLQKCEEARQLGLLSSAI